MSADTLGEGFAISDLQGRFYLFNQAAEGYLALADWLSGSGAVYRSDGKTLLARQELPLARALRGAEAVEVPLFVRAPGAPSGRYLMASCRPLRDRDGELQGAIASWREGLDPSLADPLAHWPDDSIDRSGRGDGQQAAAKTDRESQFKSRFLDSMSHELRTPLNAIIGFSELLEEQASGRLNDRQLEHIRAVLSGGRQLLRMINELLQVSNFDPARMVLSFEWASLSPIIESVGAVVRSQPEAAQVAIAIKHEAPLPPLYLDVMRTKQIVFSLLSAAIELAGNGGRVDLSTALDGSRVLITLDATPDKQRGPANGRAKAEDLTVTRRLIEMHRGAMAVEGIADNGLRFTVALPRLRGEEPLAQEILPGDAGAAQSLVLIVDDDAKASTLIASQLHAAGVSVAFARNATEALKLAAQLKPLAITLDLRMPGDDGFEVLNKLRAEPATASIPVVVISIVDERKMALAHGAVDFICKPVSGELLLSALEQKGVPVCRIKGRRILLVSRETEAMHQVEAQLRLAGCEVERLAPELARPNLKSAELVLCDASQDDARALPLLEEFAQVGSKDAPPVLAVVGGWNSPGERKPLPAPIVPLALEDAVRADRLVRAIHKALAAR